LTSNNIYRGRLRYSRQKTHQDINIKLREQAKEIIEKYTYHRKKATYLFPILNAQSHKTAMQKQNRIHKVLGQINGELKVLASELEIEADMTTYVARHSFASILKNYGVNVSLISEMLGHTDLKTTQIYLDSFENEQLDYLTFINHFFNHGFRFLGSTLVAYVLVSKKLRNFFI
jgi:hypothetical protein